MTTTHHPLINERLHGLDALRAIALILGVVLHLTLSFLPDAGKLWIVADQSSSSLLAITFFVIHMLRMAAFFVIAGFFGRLLLQRLGSAGFARDRLRRIGLPLFAGWPIVFTAIVAVIIWSAWIAHGGELPKESPPGPKFTPDDFPLTHLWFLWVLMLFYSAALLMRGVVHLIDRADRLGRGADVLLRIVLGWWAPFVLAMPLVFGLIQHSKWMPWFGVPTPDQSLYPNLASLSVYGVAFVVGWLLHRQRDLLGMIERRWAFNLSLAIAASATALAIVGIDPVLRVEPDGALRTAYAVVYSIGVWSWTLAMIGMSLRFLSGHSAVRRYIADASYWIYLAHLPLVMALQVACARLPWAWWLKFPLLLIVALALLFASYQLLVRHTVIGVILNGRKPARVDATAGAVSVPPTMAG